MHPDADIHVQRNDASGGIDVYYSVEKQIHEPRAFDSGISTKELVIRVDSLGDPSGLHLVCSAGGRSAIIFHIAVALCKK